MDKNSTVQNCYNVGNIDANEECNVIGGIIGSYLDNGEALIESCFNIGTLQGGYIVGGIAGQANRNAIIRDCYNHGKISGTTSTNQSKVGGISGQITGLILNCYNIGKISGNDGFVGGIVGYNGSEGKIKNSYTLDKTTPNIYGFNKGGIIEQCSSKTELEFKDLANVLGSAFKTDVNNGYPILAWQ